MKKEIKIAILASGAGSNANALASFFKNHTFIRVEIIICNVIGAGVFEVAKAHNIDALWIPNGELSTKLLGTLVERKIDFIVLAGFLRKIPSDVTGRYVHRIINIHPALLPKFGGKGMYGGHVHNAVIANRELESGITIHLVNDFYDEGEILFQAKCAVDADDTPSSLAAKIHRLEHEHFAPEVEKWIIKNK